MIKQAMLLWKQEGKKKGTPLQRRIFAFFACMAVFLILIFVALLLLFNINGSGTQAVRHFMDREFSHINTQLSSDLGRLSVQGISFSETLSVNISAFCKKKGILGKNLQDNPALLELLMEEQMQTIQGMIDRNICSGAFLLLDATVNPDLENAEYSRAGIFLIKTQPNAVDSVGSKLHYLRGPAAIARSNDIELLGQWRMEFDTQDQSYFNTVMQTARENPKLPLSRLYYYCSDRIVLTGNSENGFLLCVPL